MFSSSDQDVDRIASGMITLAYHLEHLCRTVADDESALPDQRAVPRGATDAAHLIWAHYGGDGRGW